MVWGGKSSQTRKGAWTCSTRRLGESSAVCMLNRSGRWKPKFCVVPVLLALLQQPLQDRKYFCQPCIDGEANPLTVRRHTRCSAYGKAWLLPTRWTCHPQRSIRVHESRFLAHPSAVAVPSVGVAHGAAVRVKVASCAPQRAHGAGASFCVSGCECTLSPVRPPLPTWPCPRAVAVSTVANASA